MPMASIQTEAQRFFSFFSFFFSIRLFSMRGVKHDFIEMKMNTFDIIFCRSLYLLLLWKFWNFVVRLFMQVNSVEMYTHVQNYNTFKVVLHVAHYSLSAVCVKTIATFEMPTKIHASIISEIIKPKLRFKIQITEVLFISKWIYTYIYELIDMYINFIIILIQDSWLKIENQHFFFVNFFSLFQIEYYTILKII